MIEMLLNLFSELGQWFRSYQYESALAIVATVLVIFGNDINNAIKQMIKKQHFIVRTFVFVLVCAIGYGLVTVWLTNFLSQLLTSIPNSYVVLVVLVVFIALGMYAQKQRHI